MDREISTAQGGDLVKTVCVIGAGVSGLMTARELEKAGHRVDRAGVGQDRRRQVRIDRHQRSGIRPRRPRLHDEVRAARRTRDRTRARDRGHDTSPRLRRRDRRVDTAELSVLHQRGVPALHEVACRRVPAHRRTWARALRQGAECAGRRMAEGARPGVDGRVARHRLHRGRLRLSRPRCSRPVLREVRRDDGVAVEHARPARPRGQLHHQGRLRQGLATGRGRTARRALWRAHREHRSASRPACGYGWTAT